MKKVYLCIPYSGMEESSYHQANAATLAVLKNGENVFSPITHSHPLTHIVGETVPGNWEFWQKIDYQFIDWADEIYVLIPREGEEKVLNSIGVQAEIKYAKEHNKPVYYIKVINGQIARNSDINFGRIVKLFVNDNSTVREERVREGQHWETNPRDAA